jgi:hypothetical protein
VAVHERFEEFFGLFVADSEVYSFKTIMARYYRPCYRRLLKTILTGPVLHVDSHCPLLRPVANHGANVSAASRPERPEHSPTLAARPGPADIRPAAPGVRHGGAGVRRAGAGRRLLCRLLGRRPRRPARHRLRPGPGGRGAGRGLRPQRLAPPGAYRQRIQAALGGAERTPGPRPRGRQGFEGGRGRAGAGRGRTGEGARGGRGAAEVPLSLLRRGNPGPRGEVQALRRVPG